MTESLNFQHLYYFFVIARSGSMTEAARRLRLAQPTLSVQLKCLEDRLGARLFSREGRTLVLTPAGETAVGYAEQIFSLGSELGDAVRSAGSAPATFRVGLCEAVPKLLACRVLEPLLRAGPGPRVVCTEDTLERLLSALSAREIDAVLSDAPLPPRNRVKAYVHELGTTSVSFLASRSVKRSLGKRFPESLSGAPLLLPGASSASRRAIDEWLEARRVLPRVVGEFQDTALMKAFGRRGHGVFPVPTAVEGQSLTELDVVLVGRAAEVKETYYLIAPERRLGEGPLAVLYAGATETIFR